MAATGEQRSTVGRPVSYLVFEASLKAAELAMQIQQAMFRLWVTPWLAALAAAVGDGRTGPVQTMQERRPGDGEAPDAPSESAPAAEGARIQLREEGQRAHDRSSSLEEWEYLCGALSHNF